MLRRSGLLFLLVWVYSINAFAVDSVESMTTEWVDSVYSSMSIEQKIGQLIVAKNDSPQLLDLLNKTDISIGGLFLPRGNANEILNKTNQLKEKQTVPFLTIYSHSGKFDEFFPGSLPYTSVLTKSSITDIDFVTQLGRMEAKVNKKLGINVTAENAISLEIVHGEFLVNENTSLAYSKSRELIRINNEILREAGMLNSIHLDLSLFNYDFIKYIPKSVYKSDDWEMLKNDYSIVFINSLDFKNGWSAVKFEKEIVKGLLRNKFDFEGILAAEVDNIFHELSGQTKHEAIEVELINAGFDLVITSNPVQAYKNLLYAYKKKVLKNQDIEDRVKNILAKKYFLAAGHVPENKAVKDYYEIINSPEVNNNIYESLAQSVTLLKNDSDLLPVRHIETTNFASLMVGSNELSPFQNTLDKYAPFTHFVLPANDLNPEAFSNLVKKLSAFDNVVVGIHAPFSDRIMDLLLQLESGTNLITTVFDDHLPEKIEDATNSLIISYEDNEYAHEIVPQIIFGARPSKGVYQVKGSELTGRGIVTDPLGRLAISKGYRSGLDEATLYRIDAIANEAVTMGATPGCQVLVARHGNIVYDKSFGFYTYDSLLEVSGKTIYDVASITKVAATTQAIMFLSDQGLLDLNEKLATYLPELSKTNKGDLVIKDVLTHQAGLQAFLPLWNQTLDVEKVQVAYYSKHPDEEYSNEVAMGMYANLALKDSLFSWMVKSDLRKKPRHKRNQPYDYKYSDLGFYLMYTLAERLLNQPMDEFLDQNLYEPLGMSSTGFNPQCKFHYLNMAPTEDDKFFRHCLVWGNVHDQIAAMNGGVSGHAGLFSNTLDLAKLGQMQLQGGTYGGHRYFNMEGIKEFTSPHFKNNRRGLGWDRPDFKSEFNPASKYASPFSYGHKGFTGTIIWVDPEYDLVYVFLSNRIYPDMNNNKLNNLDIRRRIHDVIYESIHNFDQQLN